MGSGSRPARCGVLLHDYRNATIQVGSHQLYPANARGLLQVVRDVEQRMDVSSDRLLISGKTNALNAEELTDLDNTAIYSWRWENYRTRYPHYCELAQEFRCKAKYAARANIGGLYRDWHPLGLAQDEQQDPCLESTTNYCKADWAALRKTLLPHFGSRVFLIENLDLTTIGDRYLIEFGSAGDQVIPDIGFRKK